MLGKLPTAIAKTLECVHPEHFGGKPTVYKEHYYYFLSLFRGRQIYFIDIGAGSSGMPSWSWPWHRLAYLTGSTTSHRSSGQNHGTRGKTPSKNRTGHLATRRFGAQQVIRSKTHTLSGQNTYIYNKSHCCKLNAKFDYMHLGT